MAKLTIYTTPVCPWCIKLKGWLEEEGIPYQEKDVSTDSDAVQEMIEKTGQRGVPVTIINGQVVVGFDPEGIKKILGS